MISSSCNTTFDEWVEESHPPEFDPDFDIDDLESEGIGLDPDPLVGDGVAPGMAHASTSRATWPSRASASTTTVTTVANVNEDSESEESEDSEPEDDFATHADDPISSSGDEFDD
jgi:hypothetical protein